MKATPTENTRLSLQAGGFSCIIDALEYASRGGTGVNFFTPKGELYASMTYAQLRDYSLTMAKGLQSIGCTYSDLVWIEAETCPEFLAAFLACQWIGATPAPLSADRIHEWSSEMRKDHGQLIPKAIIARRNVTTHTPIRACTFDALLAAKDEVDNSDLPKYRANDVAYIQFSSGSTAAPKGIVVEQQALMSNVDAILRHGLNIQPMDRAFNWLPLFHDMGLVGFFIASLCSQRSVDYISPKAFARSPAIWIALMSEMGSTITFSPSFGWRHAAMRPPQLSDIHLDRLRVAGIGGDSIRADDIEAFVQTYGATGFSRRAFFPSYGMAEATLAVSMGHGVDEYQETGRFRTLISCGPALPGFSVKIRNASGIDALAGEHGEIWIKGPCLARRYLDAPLEFDDEGYFDTGDIGAIVDGEVCVSGRKKEVIIIRGVNLWPQDIEETISAQVQLPISDIAAFGIHEGESERIVILIQDRGRCPPPIIEALKEHITLHFGSRPLIKTIPPRSLPLTSSGKLSRIQTKTLFLANFWNEETTHDVSYG